MPQMTKREFLSALADSLYAYSDLTDEMVQRQLMQFERYFSRMSEEEAQAAIADFDSTEAIAANIYRLIKEKERQKPAGSEGEPPRVRDYDHTASYYTVVDSETASDTEADAGATAIYSTVGQKTSQDEYDETPAGNDGDTIKIDRVDIVRQSGSRAGPERTRGSTRNVAIEPSESDDRYDSHYGEYESTHLDFTSLDDYPTQTSPMFWVLFVLTFPLWGVIALTVLALFLICFATLAALIVGLVAAMIGVAAVGTGLSLFGIIYGITQTFDVFPAGLFEIGLGVTIGGTAMFVGIALYNFAIRFLPFVMGKLTVFLKFVVRSAGRLFQRIKKECATH